MALQVSPGINTSEIDLTTIVPTVSTTAPQLAVGVAPEAEEDELVYRVGEASEQAAINEALRVSVNGIASSAINSSIAIGLRSIPIR